MKNVTIILIFLSSIIISYCLLSESLLKDSALSLNLTKNFHNKLDKNFFNTCDHLHLKRFDKYECYKPKSIEYLNSGGSLKLLYELALASHGTQHLKEHSIGRAIYINSDYNYKKTIDKYNKINYTHDLGALMHSISEEMGANNTDESELIAMLDYVCSVDNEGLIAGCFHSLGHFYGEKYVEDFNSSFHSCDKFKNYDKFAECLFGSIHEYYIQNPEPKNIFNKCSVIRKERNRKVCYEIATLTYPVYVKIYDPDNPVETALIPELISTCDTISYKIPSKYNLCYNSIAQYIIDLNNHKIACDQSEFRELCKQGIHNPRGFSVITPSCDLVGENQCIIPTE